MKRIAILLYLCIIFPAQAEYITQSDLDELEESLSSFLTSQAALPLEERSCVYTLFQWIRGYLVPGDTD